MLSYLVWYEVEMQGIAAIEEDALHKGHHISAGVVLRTHNGYMNHLTKEERDARVWEVPWMDN